MKKTVLKFWLFLALGLTTTILYSCSKDDDKNNEETDIENQVGKLNPDGSFTITATNVSDGSSQIATVKAKIEWYIDLENGYYERETDVIAQTPYENNSFTLKLPATIADKYLEPIMEEDDDMIGITVSDKTVKGCGVGSFFAYDKNDNAIGDFVYLNAIPSDDKSNLSGAVWIYVDKNVNINGQNKIEYADEDYISEFITNYNNVSLKKGWNVYYINQTYVSNQSTKKETYAVTVSMQKPSGVNLKWYFNGYYYTNYAVSFKSTKSFLSSGPLLPSPACGKLSPS